MVYSLTYTRPPHHSSSASTLGSDAEKQRSLEASRASGNNCSMCQGIPEPLSFDRIISGGTCPPCTLRDFMNYLKYIEQSAENLQFFLWLRSYTQRFNALNPSEQTLSPEWTLSHHETEALANQSHARQMKVGADTAAALKGTGLDSPPVDNKDPFHTPPGSLTEVQAHTQTASSQVSIGSDEKSNGWSSTNKTTSDVRQKAADAYDEAGLKWQPFTVQPFRDEVARIVTIYISPDGARQLNLSSKERTALLHALEHTTHPSAFRGIATTAELTLRNQSHPNFIRWTICNGNRPRVIFARGLGIGGILAGIIVDLLITLSGAGRAWRVIAFVLYLIGISTLIAAWKGMCVVLHGMHHRHLRPWELFGDEDDSIVEPKGDSMDTLDSYHSYESEPWVAKS